MFQMKSHNLVYYTKVKLLPCGLPACLQVYPTYQDFINALAVRGGLVEAVPACVVGSPQANLLVGPQGVVSLLSTHERIFTKPFR